MSQAPKFILIAPPGSGRKGICKKIAEEYNVIYLSAGEMLRSSIADGIETGKKAKIYMERNQLVPDKLMVEIVLNRINQQDVQDKGFCMKGFPKTGAQAKALLDGGVNPDAIFHLECPDEVVIERIVNRRTDPVTGKIYNLKFIPPADDDVRRRLIHRSDDTDEKARVDISAYNENLGGIMEKFSQNIYKFDANRNPNLIWYEVKPKVDRLVKFLVVFVLGGPGSGKGTQCAKISQKYGYTHLSAGDLLREERNSGSDLANMINEYIVQGKIVPAEVTINLLAKAMSSSGNKKFLIDGFPRNMENMEAWYRIMEKKTIVDLVLFFDCPEAVMQERLLERGKTSGRSDDNINTIIKRFQTFQVESLPVMRSFQRVGKVRVISAVPPPNVVFKYVCRLFNALDLIQPYQRTLGIIKPDAVQDGHAPAILEAIANANLVVLATKYVIFTDDAVSTIFFDIHNAKEMAGTKELMLSGPSLVLVIEGTDAVARWKAVVGPSNPPEAKISDPDCLRARFGVNVVRNACHASASEKAALREVTYFMDPKSVGAACEIERISTVDDDPVGIALENTLCMIKPDASELYAEEIISIISLHGYDLLAELKTVFSVSDVEGFYAEHKGKPFFEKLKTFMTSGPIIAIKLQRHGAVKGYRHLMGFTNSSKSKLERPDSLRALFGTDGTINAVHGSDSLQSSGREISFFFKLGTAAPPTSTTTKGIIKLVPETLPESLPLSHSISLPAVGPASSPLKSKPEDSPISKVAKARREKVTPSMSNTKRGEMALFLEDSVDPIMRGLVERILVKKPKDILGFAIQDLQELQRLSLGSGGAARGKLEPLSTVTAPPSKVAGALARIPSGHGTKPVLGAEQKHSSVERRASVERRLSFENEHLRRDLFVLHFNDVYEYEESTKHDYGGAARMAWQIKEFIPHEHPLVIHSGDFIGPSTTSNITKGNHMVRILNQMGVHYGVLGNHEFDFGIEVLTEQLKQSNTKWICTNLIDPRTKLPIAGCERDALIDWNGVKVGLMGIVEDWLSLCASVKPHVDIECLDLFEVAQKTCEDLRRRGAEVVIAITHCRTVVDEDLSRRVPEIDLILGGHEHNYHAWKHKDGTYGVKSGCDFRDLTKIHIALKPHYDRPRVHWPATRISITKSLPLDKGVKEVVDHYHDVVLAKMKKVIAYSAQVWDGRNETVRARESNLGNMITDFMRDYFHADIAILNGGFIRSDSTLDVGFVSMADVARFFPFPDVLTYVEISGRQILLCLENGVSRAPHVDGRFCQVSGITMTYDVNAPQYRRVRRVLINGSVPVLDQMYKLAVNGFMGGGNEGYEELKGLEWKVDMEFCPSFFNVLCEAMEKTLKPEFTNVKDPLPEHLVHLNPVVEGRVTVAAPNDTYNIYEELNIDYEDE